MRVISRKKLAEFRAKHPDAQKTLEQWYKTATRSTCRNFTAVRDTYGSADIFGDFAVFNINGNKFRLVVAIAFDRARIYVRNVLTHAEYDQGQWKTDPGPRRSPRPPKH